MMMMNNFIMMKLYLYTNYLILSIIMVILLFITYTNYICVFCFVG